jgi:hypothetical protein
LAAFAGAIDGGSILPRSLFRHFADLFLENIHCEPSVGRPRTGSIVVTSGLCKDNDYQLKADVPPIFAAVE